MFESKESADAYLASEMAVGLQATDGFDDFDVRGFDVLEELSAMTGVVAAQPLSHERMRSRRRFVGALCRRRARRCRGRGLRHR